MKLPLSWLKDYTNIDGVTPKEFDAKMTMSGSKVEVLIQSGGEQFRKLRNSICSVF